MLPSIRERNANFDNLPRNLQRVEIAKDVIKQLDLQKLKAAFGVYISAERDYSSYDEKGEGKVTKCHVCTIGAAAVVAFNGNALGRHNAHLREMLGFYFDQQTLCEMEAYFEGGRGWGAKYVYDSDGSSDTILRKCFQHFIDNNGEWDPIAMGGVDIKKCYSE